MNKLISMTAIVLELEIQLKRCIDQGMPFTDLQALKQEIQTKIFNYGNFLKQPLTLGMFVSAKLVNGVWIVLEEPNHLDFKLKNSSNELVWKSDFAFNNYHKLYDEYQESKERILFEGWKIMQLIGDSIVVFNDKSDIIEFINGKVWIFDEYQCNIINELCFYSEKENISLTLTKTAKQQIGL